jgi:hypothetical protein
MDAYREDSLRQLLQVTQRQGSLTGTLEALVRSSANHPGAIRAFGIAKCRGGSLIMNRSR